MRWFYAALFDCAWETVEEFSHNDKKLQGNPGAVTVLHTHSRRLDYHPHDATGRMAVRTLSGAAFLWLLLQHVLPKGFRRARNFGFLHPNSKRLMALLHLVLKVPPHPLQMPVKLRPVLQCPCCGGAMQIVRRRMRPATPGREPDETLTGVAML